MIHILCEITCIVIFVGLTQKLGRAILVFPIYYPIIVSNSVLSVVSF